MTNIIDELRLAVGLNHYVPGSSLTIYRKQGRPLVVQTGEQGDLDPCRMRQLLAAHLRPMQNVPIDNVVGYDLGGSLEAMGGDFYKTSEDGIEYRWFATTLSPDHVFEVLERIGRETDVSHDLEASIKIDSVLGVSAVAMTSHAPLLSTEIDRATRRAYAACITDELIFGATGHTGALETKSAPDATTNATRTNGAKESET